MSAFTSTSDQCDYFDEVTTSNMMNSNKGYRSPNFSSFGTVFALSIYPISYYR